MTKLVVLSAMICLATMARGAAESSARPTFTTDDYPELEQQTGLELPPDWHEKVMFVRPRHGRIPSKFDWRTEMNGATPIRAQGSCGSCWAFSTIAVFEWLFRIKDEVDKDLSEQYLVSCDRVSHGCRGGWWHGAFKLLVNNGAVYEEDFPYKAANLPCRKVEHQEKLVEWAYLGSSGENVPGKTPTVEEIKNAIYQYGPVGTGVHANSVFKSYKGGVFNRCTSGRTNHAVNLVGWDDEEGVWIMQNSWGEGWGEKGYMKIKYGCNQVGYATSFAVYKPICMPQPRASAGPDRVIRPGEKVELGEAPIDGVTYRWRPSAGLSDANIANPVASPPMPTLYTLEVTTSCGTAEKSAWVRVQ